MAMSTKVVKIGSGSDTQTKEFEPEAYGKKQFPKTQAAIEKRAVDAATLATAIAKEAKRRDKVNRPQADKLSDDRVDQLTAEHMGPDVACISDS